MKRVTFNDKDESWILEKPKDSDLKKVIVRDGKKWNWCGFHKKWVLLHGHFGKHASETCSLNPKNEIKKERKRKAEKGKDMKIDVNLAEDSSDDYSNAKSQENDSTDTEKDEGDLASDE